MALGRGQPGSGGNMPTCLSVPFSSVAFEINGFSQIFSSRGSVGGFVHGFVRGFHFGLLVLIDFADAYRFSQRKTLQQKLLAPRQVQSANDTAIIANMAKRLKPCMLAGRQLDALDAYAPLRVVFSY